MKKKNDINRLRSRHVHRYSNYKTCLSIMMPIYIYIYIYDANNQATFEAQFIKTVSNTASELKKALPIKKR